ncbi:MAG: 16S rRNA (cytosine(1402)-N(4))-methyltransferase RsmH [Methylobacteriaceae bacterium]|nr:16S rRNA (cytosine(1402)-N(4))-methyltransferase RsmH [Methylobacteriaceae bacterium]MBV9701796.1 16S rRNA (cytosine(1402)-N(4))-methyltransferase RsmH [Methylobacteriaceae bacterium]
MTPGGGAGPSPAAGGPARHVPVLRDQALAALDLRPGGLYLDATFGAGSYARSILAVEGTRVLALDRDPSAIHEGRELAGAAPGRLTLVEARFGELDRVALDHGFITGPEPSFDGVALDIGVSSMQLDEASRGFSFRLDGPLDMRMEQRGRSAADIVNLESEGRLADIFYHYGEERAARRIARALVAQRERAPIATTRALAELIERIAPRGSRDIHPATRVFQALRIVVNDELGELLRALEAAQRILKAAGRLVVVTFHSLEDRLVKQFLAACSGRRPAGSRHLPETAIAASASFTVPGGQPVIPTAAEMRMNPRARSAKLRFAVRTAAPPLAVPPEVAALAQPAAPGQRGH